MIFPTSGNFIAWRITFIFENWRQVLSPKPSARPSVIGPSPIVQEVPFQHSKALSISSCDGSGVASSSASAISGGSSEALMSSVSSAWLTVFCSSASETVVSPDASSPPSSAASSEVASSVSAAVVSEPPVVSSDPPHPASTTTAKTATAPIKRVTLSHPLRRSNFPLNDISLLLCFLVTVLKLARATDERRTERGWDAGRLNASAIWPPEDDAPRSVSGAVRRAWGFPDGHLLGRFGAVRGQLPRPPQRPANRGPVANHVDQ